jgi:hypothetical protein
MYQRYMLPPFPGLKYVGSEIGLVIYASYKEGGYETKGEGGKKKRNLIKANGKNLTKDGPL